MITFTQTDNNFDFEAGKKLQLRMLIRPISFAYAIVNPDNNSVHCLTEIITNDKKTLAEHVQIDFDTNPWLKLDFESSTAIFATKDTIIHPNHLYENKQFYSIATLPFHNLLLSDQLTFTPTTIQYHAETEICEWVLKHYKEVKFHHIINPILYHLFEYVDNTSNHHYHLEFGENWFVVFILKNKELKLCNNYTYRATEDILYYLSMLNSLFPINPQSKISVGGLIPKEGNELNTLEKYFQVSLVTFNQKFNFHLNTENILQHHFHSLFISFP